jgi:hypothetical protein
MIPKDLIWHVCDRQRHFRLIFLVMVFLGLLTLMSLTVIDPGSPTYVIVVINLIGIGVIGTFSGYVVYFCERWEP